MRLEYSTVEARQQQRAFEQEVSGGMTRSSRIIDTTIGAALGFLTAQAFPRLLSAGRQAIQRLGELSPVTNAYANFTRQIGSTSDAMTQRLRPATRGLLSDFELMRITNNAVTLGVAQNDRQFSELADSAIRLGRAVGLDAAQSIESLTTGIGRQSRMMLDNLGVVVDTRNAYETYANRIGVATDALTVEQQKLAFTEAATKAVMEAADRAGDSRLNLADRVQQSGVALQNERDDMLTTIGASDRLNTALDKLLNTGQDSQDSGLRWGRFLGVFTSELMAAAVENITVLRDELDALAGDLEERITRLDKMTDVMRGLAEAANAFGAPLPPGFLASLRAADAALDALDDPIDDVGEAADRAAPKVTVLGSGLDYLLSRAANLQTEFQTLYRIWDVLKLINGQTAEFIKLEQERPSLAWFIMPPEAESLFELQLLRMQVAQKKWSQDHAHWMDQATEASERFFAAWRNAPDIQLPDIGKQIKDGLVQNLQFLTEGIIQGETGNVGESIGAVLLGGIGSIFGPVGTAIGAAVGSVLGGLIGGLFEGDDKVKFFKSVRDARFELSWLGRVSDESAEALARLKEKGIDSVTAQLMLLGTILQNDGIQSVQAFGHAADMMLQAVQRGITDDLGPAITVMIDSFDQMDEAGRQAWRGFIEGARAAQEEIPELDEFMRENVAGLAASVTVMLDQVYRRIMADGRNLLDDAVRGPGARGPTVATAIPLGSLASKQLAAVVDTMRVGISEAFASGMSFEDIAELFGDDLLRLADALKSANMSLPPALRDLIAAVEFMGTRRMDRLGSLLQANSDVVERMLNFGLLPTANQMGALERTLRASLRQAIGAGIGGDDILMLFGPQIRDLLELQAIHGLKLDRTTLKLLTEAGIDVPALLASIDSQNITDETLRHYDVTHSKMDRQTGILQDIRDNTRPSRRGGGGGAASPAQVTVSFERPSSGGSRGSSAMVDVLMEDEAGRRRMAQWLRFESDKSRNAGTA